MTNQLAQKVDTFVDASLRENIPALLETIHEEIEDDPNDMVPTRLDRSDLCAERRLSIVDNENTEMNDCSLLICNNNFSFSDEFAFNFISFQRTMDEFESNTTVLLKNNLSAFDIINHAGSGYSLPNFNSRENMEDVVMREISTLNTKQDVDQIFLSSNVRTEVDQSSFNEGKITEDPKTKSSKNLKRNRSKSINIPVQQESKCQLFWKINCLEKSHLPSCPLNTVDGINFDNIWHSQFFSKGMKGSLPNNDLSHTKFTIYDQQMHLVDLKHAIAKCDMMPIKGSDLVQTRSINAFFKYLPPNLSELYCQDRLMFSTSWSRAKINIQERPRFNSLCINRIAQNLPVVRNTSNHSDFDSHFSIRPTKRKDQILDENFITDFNTFKHLPVPLRNTIHISLLQLSSKCIFTRSAEIDEDTHFRKLRNHFDQNSVDFLAYKRTRSLSEFSKTRNLLYKFSYNTSFSLNDIFTEIKHFNLNLDNNPHTCHMDERCNYLKPPCITGSQNITEDVSPTQAQIDDLNEWVLSASPSLHKDDSYVLKDVDESCDFDSLYPSSVPFSKVCDSLNLTNQSADMMFSKVPNLNTNGSDKSLENIHPAINCDKDWISAFFKSISSFDLIDTEEVLTLKEYKSNMKRSSAIQGVSDILHAKFDKKGKNHDSASLSLLTSECSSSISKASGIREEISNFYNEPVFHRPIFDYGGDDEFGEDISIPQFSPVKHFQDNCEHANRENSVLKKNCEDDSQIYRDGGSRRVTFKKRFGLSTNFWRLRNRRRRICVENIPSSEVEHRWQDDCKGDDDSNQKTMTDPVHVTSMNEEINNLPFIDHIESYSENWFISESQEFSWIDRAQLATADEITLNSESSFEGRAFENLSNHSKMKKVGAFVNRELHSASNDFLRAKKNGWRIRMRKIFSCIS